MSRLAAVALLLVVGCGGENVTNIYEVSDATAPDVGVDARVGVGDPTGDEGGESSDGSRDSAMDAGSMLLDAADASWWSENCPAYNFLDAASPNADYVTSSECFVYDGGSCNDVCASVLFACPAPTNGETWVVPVNRECLSDTNTATSASEFIRLYDDAGNIETYTTSCCYVDGG